MEGMKEQKMNRKHDSGKNVPAIIGVDPGTTVAYAVLYIGKGGIAGITADSFKNEGIESLVARITGRSFPVLVACDKKRAPQKVSWLARKLGTAVFLPKEDLKVLEKKKAVEECKADVSNDHERDALASALYAYRKMRSIIESTFSEIDKTEKKGRKGGTLKAAEILKSVLKDENYDAKHAVALSEKEERAIMRKKKEEKTGRPAKQSPEEENVILREKIVALKEKLSRAEDYIAQLKNEIRNLKRRTAENQKGDSGLRHEEKDEKGKSREAALLKRKLRKAGKELSEIIRRWSSMKDDFALAKKIDNLSWKEFERARKKLGITKGDVLIVKDASKVSGRTLEEISKKSIIVAVAGDSKKMLSGSVLTVPEKSLGGIDLKEVRIVSRKRIEKAREASLDEKKLARIISDYKRKRKEEVSA
ncbi:DUF460 domain-containing protein [Candidatus Woesearchaeota archaeon]|nr:MAG: DUF460 domain-containing protein [Candidatus Woesearchaeota archaeon]